jgi:hypothetical protein
VRLDLASLAAVLLSASACSASQGAGFAPPGAPDAMADAPVDGTPVLDGGEMADTSVPADATALPDSTCTVPASATGTTSSRCTPDGPGAWACADASAKGWLYSCQESTAGAHPQATLVGACSALGAYAYADASYVVALCASAACTAAAQYDETCDSGTALACPAASLEAGVSPGSGCVPSFIGEWSSGDGLPGPLYCCP